MAAAAGSVVPAVNAAANAMNSQQGSKIQTTSDNAVNVNNNTGKGASAGVAENDNKQGTKDESVKSNGANCGLQIEIKIQSKEKTT